MIFLLKPEISNGKPSRKQPSSFQKYYQKKESLYANFKVRGIRGGIEFTTSISVDISSLELHPGDTLEKIIDESGKKALREFRKTEYQIEDIEKGNLTYLGVAQLG